MSKELEQFVNTVICGDCLEVMRDWPDGCVDLVLTDPPYALAGMAYDKCDDGNYAAITKMVIDFVDIAERVALITIFPSGKYRTEIELYQKRPPKWRLCWHKGATPNISAVGFNDWEMMLVYGKKVWRGQHDHFFARCSEKKGNYGHPCPKPIDWAHWLISRFSNPADLILDPFCGSGTTCVAAKVLGRRYIGIDISEEYCQIARQRLESVDTGVPVAEQRKGQMAMFPGGKDG